MTKKNIGIDSNRIAHHYHIQHQKYVLTWSEYFHYGIFQNNTETLIDAQRRTLDMMADLSNINSHTDLLDVGSGIGSSCLYLANKYGCRATGVDLVESQIEESARRASLAHAENRVHFKKGKAEDLPFADNSFDVAISNEVLCHVVDRKRALDQIWRVLKPQGRFIFSDLLDRQENITSETKFFYEYLKQPVVSESLESYDKLLMASRFKVKKIFDRSSELPKNYEAALIRLDKNKKQIVEMYGEGEFQSTKHFYEYCLSEPIRRNIGWAVFLAIK
jgi:cyclopropane fatty-acyl-phospholipid synthase-like methyltransferase